MKNLCLAILTFLSATQSVLAAGPKFPYHSAAINYLAGYLQVPASQIDNGDFMLNSTPYDKIQEVSGWYVKNNEEYNCEFLVDRNSHHVEKMNCEKR